MRISDWSSDVCSSDLRDHRAVLRWIADLLYAVIVGVKGQVGPGEQFIAQRRRVEAVDAGRRGEAGKADEGFGIAVAPAEASPRADAGPRTVADLHPSKYPRLHSAQHA